MSDLCQFPECRESAKYRGYCQPHYYKLLKDGTLPRLVVRRGKPIKYRLSKHYYVDEKTGCWIWTGWFNDNGYAMFSVGHGDSRRASHVAYEEYVGPIPEGLDALHSCDRPACINPSHIFWGTDSINFQDCLAKGRHASQRGTNGRKLTPAMVRNIRIMYARGTSLETLEQIYPVLYQTLCNAVKGKGHLAAT